MTRREAGCASVDYYYDANPFDSQFSSNILGRLAAVRYGGDSCTAGSFEELYSYTAAGLTTKKRFARTSSGRSMASLDSVYEYDQEGRISSIRYPGALIIGRGWIDGTVWRYSYDTMGRPSGLSRDDIETPYVETAEYGPGGEPTRLVYAGISYSDLTRRLYTEIWSYNSRTQLTSERLLDTTYYWRPSTVLDLEYRYSSDADDGRITGAKDRISGEDVTYQYDSLGRLISAAAAGSWNIAWTYDGFGNMLTQLGNGAPSMSLQYNRATNRIITGGHAYDANGNLTAIPLLRMSYDALNRMTQATHDSNGTDQYAYDPWNRMVWNKIQSSTEYVTFYGVFGEVLGRFRVSPEAGGQFAHERRRIYFGGRQILTDDQTRASVNVADRLGSVRNSVYGAESYYPFGEIKTGNGAVFATYPRNETSNLHYATNRWYSNQIARFTTPDPWGPSATPGDPQSWNRYAYVQNDPVNYTDRTGLLRDMCLEPEMQGSSYCAYKKGGSFDLQPIWAVFPRFDGEGLGHRLILGFAPVGVPSGALGGSTGRTHVDGLLAEAAALAMKALQDSNCAGLFNTDGRRNGTHRPADVLNSMLLGRPVGGMHIGRVRSGRINTDYAAVTAYDRRTFVWTGASVRAGSADIVLQNNPNGTPYWELSGRELALTLIHELGHVFDIVSSLGGSKIKYDANPDGSPNGLQQIANQHELTNCNP